VIKFVCCLKRKKNLSRKAFQEYWLQRHGPLFKKHAKTFGAIGYIQNHTMDTPLNKIMKDSRGYQEEFDGIGEIYWPSEAAFIDAVKSPECQTLRSLFIEDEAIFTDLKSTSGFFTGEHALIDRPTIPMLENCLCPITGKLMIDPVIMADGYSYERTAITEWLAVSNNSPITKKPLENKMLISNIALKNIIEAIKRGK